MSGEPAHLIDAAIARVPGWLREIAGQVVGGTTRADFAATGTPVPIVAAAAEALRIALRDLIVERWPEAGRIGNPSARSVLTPCECEVAAALALGATAEEIARARDRSTRTIGNHITNLHAKIGARNAADVTRWAIDHGLVRASDKRFGAQLGEVMLG